MIIPDDMRIFSKRLSLQSHRTLGAGDNRLHEPDFSGGDDEHAKLICDKKVQDRNPKIKLRYTAGDSRDQKEDGKDQ
jgi:hypothetical protein